MVSATGSIYTVSVRLLSVNTVLPEEPVGPARSVMSIVMLPLIGVDS